MEKRTNWRLLTILSVIALTIYNILPTLFYYSKPLDKPIDSIQAQEIADCIEKRVNSLETHSKEWILSFCDTLQIKPQTISLDPQNPKTISVVFSTTEEAARLRKFLPRAGSLIPFAPAQLDLAPQEGGKEVFIQRKIPLHLDGHFTKALKNSPEYREILLERAAQVATALGGASESALMLSSGDPQYLEALASQINAISEMRGPAATRYASCFFQGFPGSSTEAVKNLITVFDTMREDMGKAKNPALDKRQKSLEQAAAYLKKNQTLFGAAQDQVQFEFAKAHLSANNVLHFGGKNPLFEELTLDWTNETIHLKPYQDLNSLYEQQLINEIAHITRLTNETVGPGYTISLHTLPNAEGFLVLDLETIGKQTAEQLKFLIQNQWHPEHPDFKSKNLFDPETFRTARAVDQAFCFILDAKGNAVRLFTKGLGQLARSYEAFPESTLAIQFKADFEALCELLGKLGFVGYPTPGHDFLFEKNDSLQLVAATRENFRIYNGGKYALLEFSDLKQRLLVENQIDTQIHNDLIKWRDDYNASLANLHGSARFDTPKPTKSVLLSNAILSLKKILRGDNGKVIRWGLDLSGGKTVQIELRDAAGRVVTNETDLKQGINELYNRVNKMGVSEVAIRQVGNQIAIDFPGSQALSAKELIKASSMYFHIVNETFSPSSPVLGESANRFLTEVWNEAIVTGKKDAESVNAIAWKHLYGEKITDAARTLLENGLTLASKDAKRDRSFENTTSKVAIFREGQGKSHPLLFVFNNYALEGADLENIQTGYDPSKGNYLNFDVASKSRNNLFEWTSHYSKDEIVGTPLEEPSQGRGWRMAAILNETIINAPTLEASLREGGRISGSFSQREVGQLASDLKAGSLTFTPHILSEKNVSPELGQKERVQGITATIAALFLVIASMIAYYRFAGVVASVAVFFNLLILWAVLQNIGATLSLAGIAGIILTVGMAVDANVLVFERIKEEFSLTGRLAYAIDEGYKRAYSAIIDSNVTTVIAALILLNFDAGPIKGFAVTLIIGIVSSMFTALFMTRFYFTSWIKNKKNTTLSMANWIRPSKIDFLKRTKIAFTLAFLIIALGSGLVYAKRATIFGMDFTGGFSSYLEITPSIEGNYLQRTQEALVANGAMARDFQVRELNPTNQLRILFGTSMEQPGKPFFNMPLENEQGCNPRIEWIIQSLQNAGLTLNQDAIQSLKSNWTVMSGQMSDSMRNNALLGLTLAFICIFIYIAIRFEYKFAAAAILCLLHDVLITIGFMGLLHTFGVPVQIDLNTIAAIMTIVGYSLNDTIIIFDRIREEMEEAPRKNLPGLVNNALNATLSRTTITSGTTLLVLVALVMLGGSSIFSFALVMTIGVFFGTLSSWYIASPLMIFFHKREKLQAAVELVE